MTNLTWLEVPFEQLTTKQLYDALKLRIDVFVVEQTCYYPDLDGLDLNPKTIHQLVYDNDSLVGYLRVLPPNTSYEKYASIGRVAVASTARGHGVAHQMIARAIELAFSHFPSVPIKISAQEYLIKFYESHGFDVASEMHLEDGIPHISMIKNNDAI